MASAQRNHKHVSSVSYNIVSPQHVAELVKLVEERGLPDLVNSIPVLVANSSYHLGYEDIEKAVLHVLREGTLPAGTD